MNENEKDHLTILVAVIFVYVITLILSDQIQRHLWRIEKKIDALEQRITAEQGR